jgi:hypothetical protein
VNGEAAGMDPWRPIKREPMKAKAEAKPEPEKQKPSVLAELLVGVPPETLKAVNDLAAAQMELAGKMDAVAAGNKEVAAAMKEIGAQHGELIEQLTRQTHALVSMGVQMQAWSKSIERAAAVPKKITLQRDKDGMAVAAVSKPMKEGAAQ